MGGDDQVGILQENAAQDVAAEQGAEEDEEHPGLQVEEADEGNDGGDQAAGTGEAEPAQADKSAGASQAAAKESRATPREARDRDVCRGEERRAEGSLRQERVMPNDGVRAALAQRLPGKGKAERSRTPEKDPHHGEWHVGDFCPYGRRQEQDGWSGGGERSPEQQRACGGRRKDESRSPEPHGRQEGRHGEERGSQERRGEQHRERSGMGRSSGRPRRREERDSSGSRSPEWRRPRRERYGKERHSPERHQQRSKKEGTWSPSPEKRQQRDIRRKSKVGFGEEEIGEGVLSAGLER
ncbi:unnamed protein product [Closterium sp. Naga37s-1]|nr:unnamed protein product [Closterium sp. Naga37s-1]